MQVLFATGRKPKTKGLGLEKAGVKLDEQALTLSFLPSFPPLSPRLALSLTTCLVYSPWQGAVPVDEWNRTNVESIYAVGDVTNRIQVSCRFPRLGCYDLYMMLPATRPGTIAGSHTPDAFLIDYSCPAFRLSALS